MKIYSVNDPEFKEYGEVLPLDTKEIVAACDTIEMPEEGVLYVQTKDILEATEIKAEMEERYFGGLPIQVGYCWGNNNYMNALEWHTSSEINIANRDSVLILAKRSDMENGRLDSAKCKAFLLKRGEAVEVYATSLHYCPCNAGEGGFGCVIVLPKGTNYPIADERKKDLLWETNKWLFCHVDCKDLIESGVTPLIDGENFKIEY